MPSANISGNVTLGEGVFVGSGATILQGLKVGDGAVIGAGAVVTGMYRRVLLRRGCRRGGVYQLTTS